MSKSSLRWIYNFVFLILFSSCGQNYNSNYGDLAQYGSNIDTSTPYGAALYILVNRCSQCHSTWSTKTSNDWINEGKVNPGDWNSSSLKLSLKNFSGRMPPTPYSQLTSEEVTTLQTWVNGL
jgi:uncharacterized membrane protein